MFSFDDSELIKLGEKDVKGGTLLLRRLRPRVTRSSLGSGWVEVELPGGRTELLSVTQAGVMGGYEVSGLALWYKANGVKPGDKLIASIGRYGLKFEHIPEGKLKAFA